VELIDCCRFSVWDVLLVVLAWAHLFLVGLSCETLLSTASSSALLDIRFEHLGVVFAFKLVYLARRLCYGFTVMMNIRDTYIYEITERTTPLPMNWNHSKKHTPSQSPLRFWLM
jgi:hypothetical protein